MINLKKHDPVADTIKGIMEKELVGNQKKLDKNHNGKLDSQDFKMLRGQKKASEEVESVEENAFDYKSPRQPEPNGGSGVKKGSRYGGSKQKEKPEQEEPKEKKEETSHFKNRLIERTMLKMAAKKAFKALTGGSDEDQRKDLQRKMGVPQTGKKPEPKNEEVTPPKHYGGKGTEGAKFDSYMQKRKDDNAKNAPTQKEEVESVDEVVRIFHHTSDWADPSRNVKDPSNPTAVAHRKAGADAARAARAGGNFKFKGNAKATPLTPKSSGGNVQAVKAEEVDQVQEVAPPGFEGTVKAMKKHKEIDNPFALAWSMRNKGYKSHKKADGSDK